MAREALGVRVGGLFDAALVPQPAISSSNKFNSNLLTRAKFYNFLLKLPRD